MNCTLLQCFIEVMNMTSPRDKASPPSLHEMLASYLRRQMTSISLGLASAAVGGEVQPYDAVPALPADPQLAWKGTLSVLNIFGLKSKDSFVPFPAEWSGLVTDHPPAAALPCALGNYPQMVRDLRAIVQAKSLSSIRTGQSRVLPLSGLAARASELAGRQDYTALLVAAGMLRAASHFEDAEHLLRTNSKDFPESLQQLVANELAALAWQRGQIQEATRMWEAQKPSPAVWFNRGMAALFQDQASEATSYLKKAVDQLPEDDGWQHLGRLYLALAEMRK
jgi:tetratricopeptide (TPR) repeat protein